MNTLELMDASCSSFSKTDRKIYDGIMKFTDVFAHESISNISINANITKPALTRFAQKLGFSGFAEFQYALAQDLEHSEKEKKTKTNADVYSAILKRVTEVVDSSIAAPLAEKIISSRRVVLMGTNLSSLPAKEMTYSLQMTQDVIAQYLDVNEYPKHFHKDDLILIYSATSGDSFASFMKQIRSLAEEKPYLWLVTTNAKHPLRHNFNKVTILPSVSMAENSNSVLSDTFAFLMFNDLMHQEMRHKHHKQAE